jgi:adenylate cyclase
MSCGAPLGRICPACGATSSAEARYCIDCGTILDRAAEPTSEAATTTAADRRVVTVLFADLVGFTSISERLDHETVKSLVIRCLTRLSVEVERYGGYVDQYIGDNVMAVFGAPVAHEDDPERAILAAWGMLAAIAELNREIVPEYGVELSLRVGVNTGEVSTGRIGREYTVIGDAVNTASRLQGAAPVGSILVGERTRRLGAHVATFRPVGSLTLKGKEDAVAAWTVTGLHDADGRLTPEAPGGPFVDRQLELAQLQTLFERVSESGAPHLVSVIGEAGIGKSRLLHALEERTARFGSGVQIRRGECPTFGAGLVYWPLSEMLRTECGIEPGDTVERARSRLAERLRFLFADGAEAEDVLRRLAPLARLMGAEAPSAAGETLADDEQGARESFFGAVRALVEALARQGPLMLVWEDIHRADDGLLDLVEYLAQWLRAPAMQVCLAREELLERRPRWGQLRRGATSILLEPLSEEDARALVDALALGSGAPEDTAARLARRSGGNPLFAEALVELARSADPEEGAELPETVQALLAARLDTLGPIERQLLDHAAVLGLSFTESALEPVAAVTGADLAKSLLLLRQKNLIVPSPHDAAGAEGELVFKHALIRDVAYEMLPLAARARKHAEVAAFIERRAGSDESVTPLLAEHYARAAGFAASAHLAGADVSLLRRKALECGEAAGDAATALFSNQAAIAHYRAAEAFAEDGDPTAVGIAEKRGDVELRLGHAENAIAAWEGCLGFYGEDGDLERRAVIHRKIAAAYAQEGRRQAAVEHLQRGIDLIKDLPPTPELVRLFGQAAALHLQAGDNIWAVYASERALRFAEQLGEPRLASRAHAVYGRVFGRVGDAAKAREHLERAVEMARPSNTGEEILALLESGRNLEGCEGDYEAADGRYREALDLAERVGEVPAQIELHSALAELAAYRCEWDDVARESDLSAELAEREGLVGRLCLPETLNGQLRWREGAWDASERLFVQANEIAQDGGWIEVSIRALTGLAATLRDRGELGTAEDALVDALGVCERAGFVPRIVQVHSALALTCMLAGRTDSAREAAEQAVALARRVRDPVNEAAALEASGIAAEPRESYEALRRAAALWEALGRRLDAARCQMLLGRRMLEDEPPAGVETLKRAAALFDELGVEHLSEQALTLAS